jgi:hypothetical protein
MTQAVGCQLAGYERNVCGAVRPSRRDGMLGGEATHGGQIGGPKLVHHDARGWFGKRLLDERCGVGAVIVTTGMALFGSVDEWVGAVGLVDHDSLEGRGVVGTQQPEACRVNEGLVEQRLVMLALDQLVRAATGPDRLAYAS